MISATYSSSVFENKDDYFETVSIDLKRDNESCYEAIVLFRHVERQCVGRDDEGNFMLSPDEWSYVGEKLHQLHTTKRATITRRINEITTWAVQRFNVDDLRRGSPDAAAIREALNIPFNTEHSFRNLLDCKEFDNFTDMLDRSLGQELRQSFIKFFRKTYNELPKSLIEELGTAEPKKPQQALYVAWGDWA